MGQAVTTTERGTPWVLENLTAPRANRWYPPGFSHPLYAPLFSCPSEILKIWNFAFFLRNDLCAPPLQPTLHSNQVRERFLPFLFLSLCIYQIPPGRSPSLRTLSGPRRKFVPAEKGAEHRSLRVTPEDLGVSAQLAFQFDVDIVTLPTCID